MQNEGLRYCPLKGGSLMQGEKIKELIDCFYTESTESDIDGFGHNTARREELQRYGKKVIDVILNELFGKKVTGSLMIPSPTSPTWHLLRVVEELAEPRHASRVAEMLSWEELLIGQSRSYRIVVTGIIQKIGSQSEVPALEAFAESVKVVEYEDCYFDEDYGRQTLIGASRYGEWDQEDIRKAIFACKERS